MEPNSDNHHDLVNLLSGVVVACDLALSRLGNRAAGRPVLVMLRRAADRILERSGLSEHHEGTVLPPKTVLVVDSDSLALVTMEHQLRTMGLCALGTMTAEATYRLCDRLGGEVDIALVSASLDDADGLHLANWLSANTTVSNVVTLVTQPVDLGLNNVLEKPIGSSTLERRVAALLGEACGARGATSGDACRSCDEPFCAWAERAEGFAGGPGIA